MKQTVCLFLINYFFGLTLQKICYPFYLSFNCAESLLNKYSTMHENELNLEDRDEYDDPDEDLDREEDE